VRRPSGPKISVGSVFEFIRVLDVIYIKDTYSSCAHACPFRELRRCLGRRAPLAGASFRGLQYEPILYLHYRYGSVVVEGVRGGYGVPPVNILRLERTPCLIFKGSVLGR
jgi:hypothetical protein